MLKKAFVFTSLFISLLVHAQQMNEIKINEYFNYVTLDSVYNLFSTKYKIRIIYDTALCKTINFTYYYVNTPASAALDITVKGGNSKGEKPLLMWYADAQNVVHVEKFKEMQPAASISSFHYTGAPTAFQIRFSGVMRDKLSGESLPFGRVCVRGSAMCASSNSDGYFILQSIPTDTSTLEFTYLGYTTYRLQLTPDMPKTGTIIELTPQQNAMKEVVIAGEREDAMNVSGDGISTIRMSPQKLAQLPNVGDRDIMRSFQLMPGVSAANESSSGMYVRGGTPDQNLILYDGFTVYHVDHLYGFFSAFNANAVKDVQLYKGGFDSRFGGRLSSVTEITGKDGNQKKFNAGGEFGLLSANAFLEIPMGNKLTFLAAGRRSYKSFIYTRVTDQFNQNSDDSQPFAQQGQSATEARSYFYDLNAKLTFRPNTKDIFSLSFFNGTDNLDNGYKIETPSFLASQGISFDANTSDLTRYGNLGTSLKWSRRWSDKLYGNSLISFSRYYSSRDRSVDISITSNGETTGFKRGTNEDNQLNDFSARSDYQWDIASRFQLFFGGFTTQYSIGYTYTQNDTTTILDRTSNGWLSGGYLHTAIRLANGRILINPGIRTSYYTPTSAIYNEPRLSATAKLTPKLTFKAATGKYYQFANRIVREDILSGSRDFWMLSDGNSIPVSSAMHYIAGLWYENSNYLFSVEAYSKTLDGLSEYSLRFEGNSQGLGYSENIFAGTGYARGIEFLAQKKFGKLNGWISYTLAEAKNKFEVYGRDYFAAAQDVTHEFKAVGIYSYKRWTFSATWMYATGRPYTAPSGAYTVNLLDGTTQDYYTVTAKNGLRLPDYHRLDVAVNYKLFGGNGEDRREIGQFGFSLFNVYNRSNIWYKSYDIVEGQIVETPISFLGITPNISLTLKIR
jgi:ferric enterobactin receptor